MQVNSVTFFFGIRFCDEIMSSGFGRNLSSLALSFCNDIDFFDLSPMTQLEEFIIDRICFIKESQTPIQIDTFLPCLRKLTVQICIDLSSSRILRFKRQALIELNFKCLHTIDPSIEKKVVVLIKKKIQRWKSTNKFSCKSLILRSLLILSQSKCEEYEGGGASFATDGSHITIRQPFSKKTIRVASSRENYQ